MNPTASQALRITRAVLIVAGTMTIAAAGWLYDHRAEIRAGLVRFIAACIVAAELTYRAGGWTRHAVHQICQRSCELLPAQPVPALAPITATLQAVREALAQLIARLYPEPARI